MAHIPKYDLTDRLVQFETSVMQMAEGIQVTKSGHQLSSQLSRSLSSACLNYTDAIQTESRKDFIQKFKIVLKKLREADANLRSIERMKLSSDEDLLETILKESNELISIFMASVQTATRNDAIHKEIKRRMAK